MRNIVGNGNGRRKSKSEARAYRQSIKSNTTPLESTVDLRNNKENFLQDGAERRENALLVAEKLQCKQERCNAMSKIKRAHCARFIFHPSVTLKALRASI